MIRLQAAIVFQSLQRFKRISGPIADVVLHAI
jgi:hypothetical protein